MIRIEQLYGDTLCVISEEGAQYVDSEDKLKPEWREKYAILRASDRRYIRDIGERIADNVYVIFEGDDDSHLESRALAFTKLAVNIRKYTK